MSTFAEHLLASHGHPCIPAEDNLFGFLAGDWDMEVRFHDQSGTTTFEGPGLWTASWILDGRAVQDVLTYEPDGSFPAPPGARRIGTSIRSFQPELRAWRVTWIGATAGIYLSLAARRADYGISISGLDTDGSPLHWSFTEITDDSFQWTGRTMSELGDWWTEQTMTARRRG